MPLETMVCIVLTPSSTSTFAAAVIKIVYGFDVQDSRDTYIVQLEKAIEAAEAFTPGRYLVEFFPFLRFVPAWVPGAGFQRRFAAARQVSWYIREALCVRTREGMVSFLK